MSIAEQSNEADEILVCTDRSEGVWQLTLNRPHAFNSLSSALMTELEAFLDRAASDENVRVITIEGAGRGFCAGHDLKEIQSLSTSDDRRRLLAQCSRLMTKVVHSPKPIIAKIHGIASAAGCQLVASCDLAIAADDARFATPGVNIGLFCSTPMVALGRSVSRKHAMEMLLTGDAMDAQAAARFGLINQHVPAAQLDDAAMELARKIASKSAYTVKVGKESFYRQLEMGLDEAYAFASEVMVQNMAAHDADEGIAAFVEKRSPVWQDK